MIAISGTKVTRRGTLVPLTAIFVAGRLSDRIGDPTGGIVVGSISDVTVSISITLDDELGAELNAAVAGQQSIRIGS